MCGGGESERGEGGRERERERERGGGGGDQLNYFLLACHLDILCT